MNERVYITGDRMGSPFYPGIVAIEMLREVAAGNTIVGGTFPGVEGIVQAIAAHADVPIDVRATSDDKSDHIMVGVGYAHRTTFIHTDPHASSLLPIALEWATGGDDTVKIVTPANA